MRKKQVKNHKAEPPIVNLPHQQQKQHEDAEAARRIETGEPYGFHGMDTPEGHLWRDIYRQALLAPEAEAGLEQARQHLRGHGALPADTAKIVKTQPPMGIIPRLARALDNPYCHQVGINTYKTIAAPTPESRLEHTEALRRAFEDNGGDTEAAWWVLHEVSLLLLGALGSPSETTRIGVTVCRAVHRRLKREAIAEALGVAPADVPVRPPAQIVCATHTE